MKKVYELAKELKIPVAVLIKHLHDVGIYVKSHMSLIDAKAIKIVKEKIEPMLKQRKNLGEIKLLIMDVDGVLSDNKIMYDAHGNEIKSFSPKDGLGIRLLSFTDITPAIITGRKSVMVERRAADLGIEHIYQKVRHKLKVAEELIEKLGLNWENIAYIGDDWNDYPVMKKVRIKACPADACDDFKSKMDFVTSHNGGDGAVREFIEYLLKNKGIYEKTLESFFDYLATF